MNPKLWKYRKRLTKLEGYDFYDEFHMVLSDLKKAENTLCEALWEAMSGTIREVWAMARCPECGADGKTLVDCPECGGDGGFGDFICDTCEGSCQIYELCPECEGEGFDDDRIDYALMKQAVLTLDMWFEKS